MKERAKVAKADKVARKAADDGNKLKVRGSESARPLACQHLERYR